VTAWTRRGLALSAGLAFVLGHAAPPPRPARADGIMLIQAGPFWMGRDDGPADEYPLHRVYLRDFWLDRHKVTNREFALFLEARGLRSAEGMDYFDADDADARIHRRDGRFAADPGFEDHPAVEVSWYGARDYCLWRGRRLPTEAEWEKAARGPDRRRYPWGDAPPDAERAVFGRPYNATDRGDRRPAGAGPSGVEDLLGNLREWTASEYRPYPYRPDTWQGEAQPKASRADTWQGEAQPWRGEVSRRRAERIRESSRADTKTDPRAPRVVRGASHDDPPETLRVTTRRFYSYDGGHRGLARGHHHTGFRCATSEDLGGY
jgi:iron(II)-dependent oxidoreductase